MRPEAMQDCQDNTLVQRLAQGQEKSAVLTLAAFFAAGPRVQG